MGTGVSYSLDSDQINLIHGVVLRSYFRESTVPVYIVGIDDQKASDHASCVTLVLV